MNEKWVIAYDLDVKGMKIAGYTKSNVTQFYTGVRECLAGYGFSKFTQKSIYAADADENILTRVYQVVDCLRKSKDNHFISKLNVFRMDTFSDLRPLIAGESSVDIDPIEEKIEEEFGKE